MNNKNFWEAMELSPGLFKTYVAINKLADNDVGYCFATNISIASKLNKHEKSISRDISSLIELGFLNVNFIKEGFRVIERRLYTSENLKIYKSDNKNKLIKTKTKIVEGIVYFYNEKNISNTSNKNATGKIPSNKNEERPSNKNEECTSNKNEELTNSKITNSKITTTKEILINYNLDNLTIQNILKLDPMQITETRIKEVLNEAITKKWSSGAIYKALKESWVIKGTEIITKEEAREAIKNRVNYYINFRDTFTPAVALKRLKIDLNKFKQYPNLIEEYLKKYNNYFKRK